MKQRAALLCHILVLLAACRATHSLGGFLITGFGSALLLDRYFLRLVPWVPVAWRREAIARAAWFLVGAAGFFLMRPGIVPGWEAAYRGAIVTLIAALVEVPLHLGGSWRRLYLPGLMMAAGLLALLAPELAALHPLHTVPKRGPEAFGLASEDVRFHTADGVELAAWWVPHPQARGNVIFCHGHGRNRGHVAGLLTTLHGLGLNVLAFDFRGHGASAGHTSTFGHHEVEDLLAAAAYLRQRAPHKPLFLVGVSLGAAVALQALPQLTDVRGLWSEGAFSRFADVVDNEFAWLPASVRGPLVHGYWCVGWLDCGMWVPAVNPIDGLHGCRVPIYFCHACDDELVPLAQGEALYAAHPGPKWCWWVTRATHYDVRQRNHDEYLRRLRAFLEQQQPE